MKRNISGILTTHAGSLPRPSELIELYRARGAGELKDEQALSSCLSASVKEVVRRQKEAGVNIVGDGEFGKPTSNAIDYAPWLTYILSRLGGFSGAVPFMEAMGPKVVDGVRFAGFLDRRDIQKFREYYDDPTGGNFSSVGSGKVPMCTGPINYAGREAVETDIRNLKSAMAAASVDEGFIPAVSPGVVERFPNSYYQKEEEFLYAIADAMHEEYRAIVDAGLIVQIDDPGMPDTWDQADPEPPLEEYRRFARTRIEALNHALHGLPEDRIRYHICWGSWHGPHTTDVPLHDVVDLMLSVHAGAYSVESGNVRHQHEWRIWQDVKLPKDKILIPGVVSHATNVVEHPELVAERIVRIAKLVGRENVIGGTDCGLGGRVHPQVAWAKLQSLGEGAARATQELWK